MSQTSFGFHHLSLATLQRKVVKSLVQACLRQAVVAYFEVKAVPVCPDLPKRRKLNDDLSSYRVDLDIVYVVHDRICFSQQQASTTLLEWLGDAISYQTCIHVLSLDHD